MFWTEAGALADTALKATNLKVDRRAFRRNLTLLA
jgi:hypothetical protein